MTTVLLGTVALEPNRWGGVDPSMAPTLEVSTVLDAVAAAGFDGLELWEGHVIRVPDPEVVAVIDHDLPVSIFNSYASFDDGHDDARSAVVGWVQRCASEGVKFNVGNDPDVFDAYAERLRAWVDELDGVRLLCECHEGISIAEDPAVAARLFERAGPPERVQAIVHLGEDQDLTRRRLDSYADRIGHVHVNYLNQGQPRLREIEDQVAGRIALLRSGGFDGSFTVEFTHGLLSGDDQPEFLLESAIDDLRVLREILA